MASALPRAVAATTGLPLSELLVSEEILTEVLLGTEPAALQLGLRAPLAQWAGFCSLAKASLASVAPFSSWAT